MHAWNQGQSRTIKDNQGQSTHLVRAELDTQTPARCVAAQDVRPFDGSRLWPTNDVLSTCRLGRGRRGRCRARGGGGGSGGTKMPSSDVDMNLLETIDEVIIRGD